MKKKFPIQEFCFFFFVFLRKLTFNSCIRFCGNAAPWADLSFQLPAATVAAVSPLLLCRMSVLQLLAALAAGLGVLLAFWTAKLLLRHAWYTYRMTCFSKPYARSWLLGHLGQVNQI